MLQTQGCTSMWKRVWKMDYISVVWLLQQIFGPSLWMQEQVSVPRFMSSQLFSCIRSFSDVSMLSSVFDSCKEMLTFFWFWSGLDHGTVGKELLYQLNRWCYQWEFLGNYVQRFVNELFFPWVMKILEVIQICVVCLHCNSCYFHELHFPRHKTLLLIIVAMYVYDRYRLL